MTVAESEWWRCKKCQSMFKRSILAANETKACPYCQEPSMELFDLTRADWSSGDFFPTKDEQG